MLFSNFCKNTFALYIHVANIHENKLNVLLEKKKKENTLVHLLLSVFVYIYARKTKEIILYTTKSLTLINEDKE